MQSNPNHLVIDSRVESSVLPGNIAGLLRDVTLTDGFDIRGGVYAHNFAANGSGTVSGPVFVRREATLRPPEPWAEGQHMLFQSGLAAGSAVTTEVSDQKQGNPVVDPNYIPLIIRGDIISPSVSLENAVVVGGIHTNQAVIKDSIVLGSAIVTGRLRLENVVILSYESTSVELHGRNTLLVPYSVSRSEPVFDSASPAVKPSDPLDEGPAEDGNTAWMRYFALCFSDHGCGEVRLNCPRHSEGSCPYPEVRMTKDDVLPTGDIGDRKYALTLAPRLLNMEQTRENVDKISDFLGQAYQFEHYEDSAQSGFIHEISQQPEDQMDEMERLLYRVLKPIFDVLSSN